MKKKKLKIAFGVFFGLVTVSLAGGVMFLESSYFGNFVKKIILERAPKTLGVVGDFSNLKLYLFPPGIGFANPKVQIQKDNITKLPIEASIEANELRLHFEPIQMLSGTLQVSKVVVKEGSIIASLGADVFRPKQTKKKTNHLNWDDLFELQINGVEFENTFLSIEAELPDNPGKKVQTEFVVKQLVAYKDKVEKKVILRSSGLVNAVKLDVPKDLADVPIHEISELEWNLDLSDEAINLNPLRLQLFGLELTTQGKVLGNVLDPKSPLNFTLNAKLKSDLEEFFSANEISDDAKGDVDAGLNIQGDFKNIKKTLKGQYQINGKNLKWKDASAASLEGSGHLDLANNEVQIKKISIFENEKRESGGEIELSDTSLSLTAPLEGLSAKVIIKNAPMHWAGGVVLKGVYPLQGVISGTAEISSSHSKMEIRPNLEVKGFVLDNQNMKKVKPLHYILKPKETVYVKGLLLSQPGRMDFQKVLVDLKKTKLEVNGSISGKDGFDLHAKGVLDLEDFNEIAESPIRGTGVLTAWVHGNADDGVIIDFDPELDNAEYINLKLGQVKGRLTYDEGADELRFSGIHAKKEKTFYSVTDGLIDLGDASEIRLPFVIHSGRVEDLIQILAPVIKKVSWFPMTLKGEVHGTVNLHGKTSFANMIIDSNLEGVDWSLLGERARKVKMNFGYDQGTYFARDFVLSKTSGSIRGMIEFNSVKDSLDWSFATDGFSLNDIDFFERLEIPARSKIEFKSTGTGQIDHLVSNTSGRFFQTQIKGEQLDPSAFNLDVSESTLRAGLDVFGKRLHAQLRYALIPKQPSSLSVEANNFDFSPAILILNPKLLDDPNLLGLIDGRVQFDFLSTQSELARGEIQLKKYILKKTGFSLQLSSPIQTAVQLGYFNIAPAQFKFNDSQVVLSGEGKRGDVDLELKGTIDLAIAELLSASIQKVNGKADTDLHITGPLKDLKLNGDISFSNAYVLMRWLQTPFEEMDGSLSIRQNILYVEDFDSFLGDEVFSLSGQIETHAQQFPKLDLRAQFDDNKIKMQPLEFAQVRGTTFIKGDSPPYQISGSLDLPQALWTKSFSQSGPVVSKADRFAPTDTDKQIANNLFNLDLQINAPQGFNVRNEVMDAEFRGKVKLVGPPDNPKLLGEGQLVQGKVLFRDRPFFLESVRINFDDPYSMNPKFSASAISDVNQYKVKVLAYGRSSSWKAEFSSTPFLPESDIFSLLASGSTNSNNSRFQTRDRSYVNQGEAASLVLHSLDFGKDIQSKTGLQFDVEEAVDSQSASSIFSPQNLAANVAAPKLVLKRQFGDNWVLSYGNTVGVGHNVQREGTVGYKFNRSNVSILGVYNNTEDPDTRENITSFGLDLKFNQRFK